MRIVTGNLISRRIVRDMLEHLPKSDLCGLRKICIMLRPPRSERCRYGLGDYFFESRTARVFLWSIKDEIKRQLMSDNNFYHIFLRQIALTLYHEIGHHKHYTQGNGKELSERHEQLEQQKKRAEDSNKSAKLSSEMWDIHSKMEEYADDYMNKKIKLYYPLRPSFKEIRFIKIFREKWVDFWMNDLRKTNTFNYHNLNVIWHLRKCSLSRHPLYSVREICDELHNCFCSQQSLKRKFRRKMKQACLELAKPLYYVSKSGRRFPYFTIRQMEIVLADEKVKSLGEEYKKVCEKVEKVESLERELHWARQELAKAF